MKKLLEKIRNNSKSYSASRRTVMACPLAFAEVGVKGRVKSVLNYKKPAFWAIVVALLACIAVAVGFLSDPKGDIDPENAYAVGKNGVVTIDEYVNNYQNYLGDGYLEDEAKRLAQRKSLEFEATYQEALRQGFSVSIKEIKEYIAEVKESFTIASNGEDALKSIIWRYGSEEAYYEYLEIACKKSLPVNKYLKDLEQQWLKDLDNDFDTFDEYKNVVVGKLVIKEDFKLANGESANYLIEELATEEPLVTEKNDADKYAATYKDKMSASSINDYEHAIALCEDAVEEFIDAVRYQQFYDFTPYIEDEMLISWIEYRAANHIYAYDNYTEYDVVAENVTWHDNYAVFHVGVGADNYSEGYSYMVVQNLDGVLRITDWYWDDKDSPDETYRGEFDFQFNPTYWEKLAVTKSEISTGIRFKITNKDFDITETMQQSDEFLMYMLFQNEWSEGLELKEGECDLILEVYDNKIQYNSLEGIFIDTKNNRSLTLNENQKTELYYLLNEYGVVLGVEDDVNYGIKLNVYNVTPSGADIEITQDSTNFSPAAHTGAEYWLERLGENGWEECEYIDNNKNRSWVAIAYNIPYEDSINWGYLYGTLSPGEYRVGKSVTIKTSKTSINRILYAEFEIE